MFGADLSEDRPTRPAYLIAASVVFLSLIHQLLTRGEMILSGSMWAEMATNYYSVTTTEPWYRQLLSTDAGYIPLPQRLLALLGDAGQIPPQAIPYLYSAFALVGAAALAGSLCLPAFRPLMSSDLLRGLLAGAIVLVPDFETRTFINFTYLSVVLIAAITALAAVDSKADVPRWAYLIPVMIISKPGVLTVLPAMLVVSLVSHGRFKIITALSLVAGLCQALQLYISSQQQQSLLQDTTTTSVDKLVAAVGYTVGLMGRIAAGPDSGWSTDAWVLGGAMTLAVAAVLVATLRSSAGALVLVGFSLVFFAMLVNAVTFSVFFTRDLALLPITSFDRRFVVALVGCLFVVAGIAALLADAVARIARRVEPRSGTVTPARLRVVGAALFTLWFLGTGWLGYAARINQPPPVPTAGMSQWADQAWRLSTSEEVVCIPLDPYGWLSGRDCSLLAGQPIDPATVAFGPALDTEGERAGQLPLSIPASVEEADVYAVTIVVRSTSAEVVDATLVMTLVDGSTIDVEATRDLPTRGGALTFSLPSEAPASGVVGAVVNMPSSVSVARGPSQEPLVLWMGLADG